VKPPETDAPDAEWTAWARSIGRGHLDPERLRLAARHLRAGTFGMPADYTADDVNQEDPVKIALEDLGLIQSAALVIALEELPKRAGASFTHPQHPALVALRQLASTARSGTALLPGGLDRASRHVVHKVLQLACQRAEQERSAAEPALRRILAAVETAGWAPQEDPPPRRVEPTGMWTSSELFRPGR
jgi:hypothetical protein